MKILGLTGSIGMGKTTTAAMFRQAGVPVFDADEAVHRLYARGGAAVHAIGALCAEAVSEGQVDRAILGAWALQGPDRMAALEAIVHPLVYQARERFLASQEASHSAFVLVDIPLLFETHAQAQFDLIVVVTAPAHIQKERVLSRPGQSPEKLSAILSRQWPDARKRQYADFVIQTGLGLTDTRAQVRSLIEILTLSEAGPAAPKSAT